MITLFYDDTQLGGPEQCICPDLWSIMAALRRKCEGHRVYFGWGINTVLLRESIMELGKQTVQVIVTASESRLEFTAN